eukprot:COSAG01_NODE_5971_length_3923_cov_1.636435_1_plen_93_part_00
MVWARADAGTRAGGELCQPEMLYPVMKPCHREDMRVCARARARERVRTLQLRSTWCHAANFSLLFRNVCWVTLGVETGAQARFPLPRCRSRN